MVINITRWSPDHCGCVIDYTWDDSVPAEERKTEFFALVQVCPDHQSLATKIHGKDHFKLAGEHNKHLDKILERNLAKSQDSIDKAKYAHHKRQLLLNHVEVAKHNQNVKEEYEAIFSEPHAHDSHIHQIVLEENQRKNKVHAHILETMNLDMHQTGYHFAGDPTNRTLHPHIVLAEQDKAKLHEHFDKQHGKDKVRLD